MKEQMKIQWFKFRFAFSAVKVKKIGCIISYMIHWAKFLLKTKISPMDLIFKDDLNKYFPKESI